MKQIIFPTELHRIATTTITDVFAHQEHVDTILLVNSLARGKGTPESDIDIVILVKEKTSETMVAEMDFAWQQFLQSDTSLHNYISSNRFAQVHLDIIDGTFQPAPWEDGGAIDFFEVEIGNRVLYSAALTNEGGHLKKLKEKWLPYYNTHLRNERLQLCKEACNYDLDHLTFFVKRGLYFQAFDRLYITFQRFLQALFISHHTYPIAYNKWIKEQVSEILKLPELYDELPEIISVNNIESHELISKAQLLQGLIDEYC